MKFYIDSLQTFKLKRNKQGANTLNFKIVIFTIYIYEYKILFYT